MRTCQTCQFWDGLEGAERATCGLTTPGDGKRPGLVRCAECAGSIETSASYGCILHKLKGGQHGKTPKPSAASRRQGTHPPLAAQTQVDKQKGGNNG